MSLWESFQRNRRVSYRLNRDHPIVRAATEAGGEPVAELLRFVEETVPASRMSISDETDAPAQSEPFEGPEQAELMESLRRMYRKFREMGSTADEARKDLASMEPFYRYPALLGMLEEEV